MEFVEGPAPLSVTIRAYVSDLFPTAPGEWPQAWAIVNVDPGGGHSPWAATLEVDQLVRELRHKAGGPMRDNLAFEWSAEGFSLYLGPARVTGTVALWRALIKRVLAEAGNTSELYETPSTRPWRGLPTPVGAAEVVTGSETTHDSPVLSRTDTMVADALLLSPTELVDLIGVCWSRYRHDGRLIDSDDEGAEAALYTWGEPAQLAVIPDAAIAIDAIDDIDLWADGGLDPRGRTLIGVPHPTWDGLVKADAVTHRTLIDPWAADEIVTVVKSLRSRRRRAFGFCQHCGTYSAPEDKLGRLCWGCAGSYYGLIY